MKLFKKKNEKLSEKPLGYWEEKSYMMIIPKNNDFEILPEEIIKKLRDIRDVTFERSNFDEEKGILYVKMKNTKSAFFSEVLSCLQCI